MLNLRCLRVEYMSLVLRREVWAEIKFCELLECTWHLKSLVSTFTKGMNMGENESGTQNLFVFLHIYA